MDKSFENGCVLIVGGSGGKDSCYAAHVLKYKFGMNPLTVTWPPILYTEYGLKNFKNWIKSGRFKNISAKRDEKTMRELTKLSILNLLHPFQTFMLGQKIFPVKIALKYKIPLVFYGENEAEHGSLPLADNNVSLRNKSFYTHKHLNKLHLGGVPINSLTNVYKLKKKNLEDFLPPDEDLFSSFPLEVHYLGYYLKWIPQETFYYAVENSDFRPRPFRTQGTYSKYNSIDDKIDDLHYYTTFIKFGIGRATYDAAQEVRNKHLTRDEAIKLVARYDGEFPDKYINDVLDYVGIKISEFQNLCDKFRSPHLWKKTGNGWKLRNTIYET